MSSISGRLGRLLAGASTIVAIAATLTLAPSATAGVEADGPNYQAPTVSECRNYTLTAADKPSNTTPVTPCSSTHTAKVFFVGQLPEALTWASSADAIGKAVSDACGPAFDQKLGGTEKLRRMSAYTFFWFEPTTTQQSHGARWFRCDVAMWGHQALTPIPNVAFPLLGNGLKYGVTRCLYGTEVHYTACKLSHSYRATGAFSISGTTYPGDTAIRNTAVRRCPNFVSTRAYYWVGPNRTSWKYGDRIFVCYSKVSH